jgi:hypothetical protein
LANGTLNNQFYRQGCLNGIINYALYNGFNHIVKNEIILDSCNNNMSAILGYSNDFTQYGKHISATYNPTSNKNSLSVGIDKTTSTNVQDIARVDYGGDNDYNTTPTVMTIRVEPDYTGNLFEIIKNSVSIFKINSNGIKRFELPIYDNDADAIANGLIIGDAYELSATNTYSLPVGLHKTVR